MTIHIIPNDRIITQRINLFSTQANVLLKSLLSFNESVAHLTVHGLVGIPQMSFHGKTAGERSRTDRTQVRLPLVSVHVVRQTHTGGVATATDCAHKGQRLFVEICIVIPKLGYVRE